MTTEEIDLESIRISQDFISDVAVKPKLTIVAVTKPHRNWWFRIHPSEDYQIVTGCIEDKESGDFYLVVPALWNELSDEIGRYQLFTAVTRSHNVFLYPVRLPNEDNNQARLERYYASVTELVSLSKTQWVRAKWNRSLGAYQPFLSERPLPDPIFPEESFQKIINIAFKDKIIDAMDHPIVEGLLHGV